MTSITQLHKKLIKSALTRFVGYEVGKAMALFYRHDSLADLLDEPIVDRIDYILKTKPVDEIIVRLAWIQPYRWHPAMREADWELEQIRSTRVKASANWRKIYALWERNFADILKAHAQWRKADSDWDTALSKWTKIYEPIFLAEHPDCPWDGKTLFPAKARRVSERCERDLEDRVVGREAEE